MKGHLYWYWLCNIKGIGLVKTKALLECFYTPEAIWWAKEEELKHISLLKAIDINNILSSKDEEQIRKSYEELVKRNIRFISIKDKQYPEKLKRIYDPPFGLYVKGKLPDENKPNLAIIGARNCSAYGKEMAKYFSRELGEIGVQITSGLARGIDAVAHRGALDGKGQTFGVLGNGLNICYPQENFQLSMEMEHKGGLISEYNLNVSPKSGHFPMRNRIISGLCDGIFVIEAAKRSGSLITAELALDQGKDIFALPGRVTDQLSLGTNALIKIGAKMVTSIEDILEEFNLITDFNQTSLGNNSKKTVESLDKNEKIVYARLNLEPKFIDHIVREVNMNIQEVMHILFQLELKGAIKQLPNKHFIINV
jgi:DNA processing protein